MKRLLLSILVVVFFASCCSDKTMEKINALESSMIDGNGVLRNDVGMELVGAYVKYAKKNSEDEKAPDYLFKAIDISVNLVSYDYRKSVEIADMIVSKYPDHELAPMALYLKGFIYEELMHDEDKAKQAYNEFIEKYPNNPMVEEVKASLSNVGVSDLELIRRFEMLNSDSDIR